jgi:hypothetical protein
MKRSKASPVRLVGLSLLGTLVVVSGFLLILAISPYRNTQNIWLFGSRLIAFVFFPVAIFCGGFYLSIRAQQKLSKGIGAGRWTEAELQPVRSLFESWPVRSASWVLIGTAVVTLLIDSSHPHHGFSIGFWICFVLLNWLMGFKRSLIPPSTSEPRFQLQTSAPLQSEHWGE